MRPSRSDPTAPFRDAGRGGAALLIVDVVNRFDFEGGEDLKTAAAGIVEPILALREAADAIGVPTIYANDNFGEWHSEKSKLVNAARSTSGSLSRLEPRSRDYFVIKPQLSAFYSTNLPVLLPKLGVGRLVLVGIAADMCVLFTAADGYMRDYGLWVPRDAVAAQSEARTRAALTLLRDRLAAETAPTSKLRLAEWLAAGEPERERA